MHKVESAEVGKTVTVEMDLTDHDFGVQTHCFLSVQMFNVSGVQIVDSAGTFTLSVMPINSAQYEVPSVSVIDATAPTTLSWAANTLKIKIVPASLSDTVTYKVVATSNHA
jgi:hypothetical protein